MLSKDIKILEYSRKMAIEILKNDENLTNPENKNILNFYNSYSKEKNHWNRIS